MYTLRKHIDLIFNGQNEKTKKQCCIIIISACLKKMHNNKLLKNFSLEML